MDEDTSVEALKDRLAATEAALRDQRADLERLREAEIRHTLLIGSWAQAVWETDPNGVVVTDSPSWRAYTGQRLEEWLGYGWLDAIHPEDREYAERQWRDAMAARSLVNAEFRLRSPDGGWRWTNVRAAPVIDVHGNIKKWAGMNIDIEASKHAEVALRESEGKYRTVFDTIDEGFITAEVIYDDAGRAVDALYLESNPAASRLTLGRSYDHRLLSDLVPNREDYWIETYDRVARTGTPERLEKVLAPLERWYNYHVSRVSPAGEDGTGPRVAVVFQDVTERRLAENKLRESEERQAFLLRLSDALRPLADTMTIKEAAARVLGEHLQARRIFYAEVEGGDWLIDKGYERADAPRAEGRFPIDAFGRWVVDHFRAGQRLVANDLGTDVRFDPSERVAYGAYQAQAIVAVPLVKEGELVALLVAHNATPRAWIDLEVYLVEETAERTWAALEKARAEAALRQSEARFAQFAASSLDALWIRDAPTLAMNYVSPAIKPMYGVEPEVILGDVRRWAALIVPEDRNVAIHHLEQARQKSVVHEFRIQRPTDGSFRWIRNTEFPLYDEQGRVQGIGGLAHDDTEAKLATEHLAVLLAELQHRVRNIMGMVRSVANRTAAGAKDVADYRVLLEGRLLALARVQALLTREANAGGSLRGVLEEEIAAQAHHGGQYELTGPDVRLSPKAVEVLTLAFHELATNALKYGALSVPNGRLAVRWALFEKHGARWLSLDWNEDGEPPRAPSSRRGFGSELIEGRVAYELRGAGRIAIGPDGARCHLEFPLEEGESILETDAPQPTTIFGGNLDMTGAADLTGRTILVVEDDYYMAMDTAAALRGAGAEVLGPCPSEAATRDLLEYEAPTHAVLDLNLGGGGPQFEIARLMKARGVPFVFLTGYDPDVIPDDMRDIARLQKPLPFRAIVEAVSQL